MRTLITVPATWAEALTRPNIVHVVETRDGQPRRFERDGVAVGVAVCGVLLAEPPADPASLNGRAACVLCAASAEPAWLVKSDHDDR